ncbi:barstar family protein [Actinospica durhamensis]|uniref:barstar family protein n=1 Tax=Actinospica durhamensis TaxID=1508375 RepID=UPI0034D3D9B3
MDRDREDFGAQNSEPPPTDVTIPLGDVRTTADLHRVLKQQLGFPDFYGMNWDAFWDSITGLVERPDRIVFTGWAELAARLPRDAGLLRKILGEYQDPERSLSSHAGGFTASYE